MTKTDDSYSDDVKAGIYEKLRTRDLRFNELADATGRDRMTLSRYLGHALDVGEVFKAARLAPYSLTPKGRSELARIEATRALREEPPRFSWMISPKGEVDSEGELEFDAEHWREGSLPFSLAANELPLPVPVQVALYASKELTPEIEKVAKRLSDRLPPNQLPLESLKRVTRPFVKSLLWAVIDEKLERIVHEHECHWLRGHESPDPTQLTLENLLTFDFSLTMSYRGASIPPTKTIAKRLAGTCLVRLAYSIDDELQDAHGCRPWRFEVRLWALEEGGLLEEKDLNHILAPMQDYFQEHESHKSFTGRALTEEVTRVVMKRVLETGLTYLRGGGVLQMPDDVTVERLAERLLTGPVETPDIPQYQVDPRLEDGAPFPKGEAGVVWLPEGTVATEWDRRRKKIITSRDFLILASDELFGDRPETSGE